jgi:hypothetical protein
MTSVVPTAPQNASALAAEVRLFIRFRRKLRQPPPRPDCGLRHSAATPTLILQPCDFTLIIRTTMALPAHDSVDDDLAQIEKDIRQLKIEYEMYFAGGRKRPPADTQWRVDTMIKRYNDRSAEMNSGQRFHLTNLTSTYAKYQEMWRKKLMAKETGTTQRHYGSAARAIEAERSRVQSEVQRNVREREALRNPRPAQTAPEPEIEIDGAAPLSPAAAAEARAAELRAQRRALNLTDPVKDVGKVRELYDVLVETRIKNGEGTNNPSLADFERFVQKKTEELQRKGGKEIGYSVGVENGKVKLKARIIR